MIQHNMQTLKVGHKVRLLDCYFVILSFFILPLGDTNRGLLVRYIYIIYYFIIYILYIIYTHGAKMTKWQNDKMTFFVSFPDFGWQFFVFFLMWLTGNLLNRLTVFLTWLTAFLIWLTFSWNCWQLRTLSPAKLGVSP